MKRAQWNRLADDFESEVCDITREEATDRITRFVNAARLPKRDSVLVDLGCGLGTFVSKFGGRFTQGPVRVDAAIFWGLNAVDPTVGFMAGATYIFNAFRVP